jgi:hypothetical protein
MSVQVPTTQRRASWTPRGPDPSDRAGLFNGTAVLHDKDGRSASGKTTARTAGRRGLVYPRKKPLKHRPGPLNPAVQTDLGDVFVRDGAV